MQSREFEPGQSDIHEAAETLEQALTEACSSRPAHEADTGELIRVEEMLALAGDAARRAISLRRKARQRTESRMEREPETSASTEIDQPPQSAHRTFDDARGLTWDVWAVYPEGRPSQLSALPGTFPSGWLVFESAAEKRRLSPIPAGWLTLSSAELEQLCLQALSASRRPRSRRRSDEDTTPPE